jgi:glycine/D-amino acid oxidase-like deaminating enzyme/nitrite reductase/ring-hydroxylating ferredoxin subunit
MEVSMQSDSGRTRSIWMSIDMPAFPALRKNASADVCVVGGGITGLTTAYLLMLNGKSVIVLEDGPLAGGASARTSAHLTAALDDRYHKIEDYHGKQGARMAAQSHSGAIDLIESIVIHENIDCDFERVDGYLFLAPESSPDELQQEYEAAQRAGLNVHMATNGPYTSFDTGPCIVFSRQAQFHPIKYLAALARLIKAGGGRIYTGTHATEIEDKPPVRISTAAGPTVKAGAVVVATNSPIVSGPVFHTKQAAYRTYVIGVRVPHGSVPRVLAWDTGDPYYYLRVVDGSVAAGDILLAGGEDHKTGQMDDNEAPFARLEEWTRARFPQAGELAYRWSGQVMEPVDYMAFIGRNPRDTENVYIATGDSGNGLTHGTIAGMLLTDMIMGHKHSAWEKFYSPSRKTLHAAKDYTTENVNVAAHYGEWLTPGDVDSVDAIPAGNGAILRKGMKKIAVYRDDENNLHMRSAKCPHQGCVVQWNNAERSWDCPCHGSRFDPYGHVVNGPANSDLAPEPADVEAEIKATGSEEQRLNP